MSKNSLPSMRWDEITRRVPTDRPYVGVEVGVWRGENARRLLEARPQLCLYLVDAWTRESQGRRLSALCSPRAAEVEVREMAEGFGVHRTEVLCGLSAEMAERFTRQSVDFVFIDAQHHFAAVASDIAAWLPKVRPGGWIGGHDYGHERFPGVAQAVHRAFGHSRVATGVDHTWFVEL